MLKGFAGVRVRFGFFTSSSVTCCANKRAACSCVVSSSSVWAVDVVETDAVEWSGFAVLPLEPDGVSEGTAAWGNDVVLSLEDIFALLRACSSFCASSKITARGSNSAIAGVGPDRGSQSSGKTFVADAASECFGEHSYGFGTWSCSLAFRRQYRMRKCPILLESPKKSVFGRG